MPKTIEDFQIAEGAFALRNRLKYTLEQTVAAYERDGVPLPARQYWTINRSSIDCEQVAVSFVQAYLGTPGDQAAEPLACSASRTAVVDVAISRKWPIGATGAAIPAKAIMEASDWAAVDAWVLLNNLAQISAEPDGYGGAGVIATVTTDQPTGGIITTRLQLTYGVLGSE